MNLIPFALTALLALVPATASFAELLPNPDGTGGDARVTHFHYKENQVYRINVAERITTFVHFPAGEVVRTIGNGDDVSFQVTRLLSGTAIQIKPQHITDANLTVLTNRGTYNFYLTPSRDRGTTPFRVTIYGDENHSNEPQSRRRGSVAGTEARPTGHVVNTSYTRSGTAPFEPRAVWDDGVHTYMQIPEHAELPGIFRVLPDGQEQIVNTTTKPNGVIQVHGLSNIWSVRIEEEAICIRNEGYVGDRGHSAGS